MWLPRERRRLSEQGRWWYLRWKQGSGLHSVFPGPAAALPGNLLERQTWALPQTYRLRRSGDGPAICALTSPLRNSDAPSRLRATDVGKLGLSEGI